MIDTVIVPDKEALKAEKLAQREAAKLAKKAEKETAAAAKKAERDQGKAAKDAEKEAKVAAKAAKDAEKASKQSERDQKKSERDAKQAERDAKKSEREAKKAERIETKASREANRMPEKNGIRQPRAETACGKIWTLATELSNARNAPVPMSVLKQAATDQNLGIDEGTLNAQYARWRKFHGVTGRIVEAVEAAPAAVA